MCGCGIGEPCYGCSCGCDHLTSTLLDYYQRGMTLSEIYQRGFLHGSQSPKPTSSIPQSESEKFFAHLNNGEVILVEESRWEERQKQLLDINGGVVASMEHLLRFRVVVSGGEAE